MKLYIVLCTLTAYISLHHNRPVNEISWWSSPCHRGSSLSVFSISAALATNPDCPSPTPLSSKPDPVWASRAWTSLCDPFTSLLLLSSSSPLSLWNNLPTEAVCRAWCHRRDCAGRESRERRHSGGRFYCSGPSCPSHVCRNRSCNNAGGSAARCLRLSGAGKDIWTETAQTISTRWERKRRDWFNTKALLSRGI